MKKSPIDSEIVDLIMTHFNVLSFEGKPEILTGDQFMELVKMAEKLYYKKIFKNTDKDKIGLA